MNLFVIDIGGSTIKYAEWNGETLEGKRSLPTPKTWEGMKQQFVSELKNLHGSFQAWRSAPLVR